MQENVLDVLPATLGGAEGRGCPLCSCLTLCTISEHNGKQLRKCGHCGARFLLPQPVPIAVVAYFEDGHAFSDADLETKFERTREPVLARVADYIQSQKRGGCIVDVGCATGFFL